MADTLTEVANLALGQMGEAPVTNITTGTEARATVMYRHAKRALEHVFGRYNWPELVAEKTLNDSGTTDTDGNVLWALPTDVITPISLINGYTWLRKGRFIVTDDTAPTLVCIEYSEDPSAWSPWLLDAVVFRWAADACYAVTTDRALADRLEPLAALKIDESISYALQAASSGMFRPRGLSYLRESVSGPSRARGFSGSRVRW